MKKLIVIGDSGHAKVIKDIAVSLDYRIVAVLDDKYTERTDSSIIFSPLIHLNEIIKETNGKLVIAIGSNEIRKKMIEQYDLADEQFVTLVSKAAHISPSVTIGSGTVVMPGAIINADVHIGRQVIINTGAVVEHDNVIGDYCHLSPNATSTGGVTIEQGTHIGAGAIINPQVRIGEWCTVGSGAAVIHDIDGYTTAVGLPAKAIKYRGHRI